MGKFKWKIVWLIFVFCHSFEIVCGRCISEEAFPEALMIKCSVMKNTEIREDLTKVFEKVRQKNEKFETNKREKNVQKIYNVLSQNVDQTIQIVLNLKFFFFLLKHTQND